MNNTIIAVRSKRPSTLLRAASLFGLVLTISISVYSLVIAQQVAATQESASSGTESLPGDTAPAGLVPERPDSTTLTKLTFPGSAAFGLNVELSGNTALIASSRAIQNSPLFQEVFVRGAKGWAHQATLPTDPGENLDREASISGDTAAVLGNITNSQHYSVFVFVRNEEGVWTKQQRIQVPPGTAFPGQYVTSISMSGDTLVFNAFDYLGNDQFRLITYIFVRNGTVWTLHQQLISAPFVDRFGLSTNSRVAISGDTLISSRYGGTVGENEEPGSAKVYVRTGTAWSLQQTITPVNSQDYDAFGSGVAISQDTILIGAMAEDTDDLFLSAAYVYVRNGTVWTQQKKLVPSARTAHDSYGFDVAIVGDMAIVGAPQDDVNGAENDGSVYAYHRCGNDWTEIDHLTADVGINSNNFGSTVSMAGDTIITGAPYGVDPYAGVAFTGVLSLPLRGEQCQTGIIVNVNTDEPDDDPNDHICDIDTDTPEKECSLRAAIRTAEEEDGADVITFNIPGSGIQTITPASALPNITERVTINATTQPGYSGTPVVEVRGDLSGTDGFVFTGESDGSVLKGLTINRFKSTSGNAHAGVVLLSDDNRVENCIIGLKSDGLQVDGPNIQNFGIRIEGSNNTIGGQRGSGNSANNIIAGNSLAQVFVTGVLVGRNKVKGNNIGINAANEPPEGEFNVGIYLKDAPTTSEIGGTTAAERNYITSKWGIKIETEAGFGGISNGQHIIAGNAIAGCELVGIEIQNSGENTIGGNIGTAGNNSRNYFWGNGTAILINNTASLGFSIDENKIFGNIIGSAPNGTYTGNNIGITLENSENNFVGDGTPEHRNIIAASAIAGISLGDPSKGNWIRGNYIGTGLDGDTEHANTEGVSVSGTNNHIVGNTISGNDTGLSVSSSKSQAPPSGNTIDNNRIGIAATSNEPLPNGDGIVLFKGITNVIGNTISGNDGNGISIFGDANNITNNKIGTDPTGNTAIGNGFNSISSHGIRILGTQNIVSGNTISGNKAGVDISKGISTTDPTPANNRIEGNFIGTNSSGSAAVPNTTNGVEIGNNAIDNFIGGTSPGSGNVISGNGENGIYISIIGVAGAIAPFETKIKGNRIGTNADGTSAIPNVGAGIWIRGGISSRIGGVGKEIPAARNIISGNGSDGIRISDVGVVNRVTGNYIGVAADGVSPLGNTGNGVTIASGSASNIVGGPETNSGNVIAHNANGVVLTPDAGAGNLIDPNRIFGNLGMGIDIGGNGPTPNDPHDADTGPNNLQNYPSGLSKQIINNELLVTFRMDSAPAHSAYGNNGIYVEFFKTDPTGQGEQFLGYSHYTLNDYNGGALNYKTVNLGNINTLGVTLATSITASATDANGNTSEFTPLPPTAAGVTIAGRVTTREGRGVRGARVSLTNPEGATRTAMTGAGGSFIFADVEPGTTYVISVASRRFQFTPRVLTVNDNVGDIEIVAEE